MSDVLLVIDMQQGVCHENGDIYGLQELVPRINHLVAEYNQAAKPVVFIQHNDEYLVTETDDWQIIPELDTSHAAAMVQKTHANSFYHTTLQRFLDSCGAKSLEICGAQTEYCVDSTIKFAHGLGYDVTIRPGMATTYDNEFMTATQTNAFYKQIWQDRFATMPE